MTTTGRFMCGVFLLYASALVTQAQVPPVEPDSYARRNMGGPRLGATYVLGNNLLSEEVKNHEMGRLISEFGWAFEGQVVPEGGGPLFVIQVMPLIAGVEYGRFIPGISLLMGVRFPAGWQIALGPNVSASGEASASALEIALAKSFDYGGVSVPLGVSYTNNLNGSRISFMIGYSVTKRRP